MPNVGRKEILHVLIGRIIFVSLSFLISFLIIKFNNTNSRFIIYIFLLYIIYITIKLVLDICFTSISTTKGTLIYYNSGNFGYPNENYTLIITDLDGKEYHLISSSKHTNFGEEIEVSYLKHSKIIIEYHKL